MFCPKCRVELSSKKGTIKGLIIGITAGILVITAAAVIVVFSYIIPDSKYNKALDIAGKGRYDDAIEAFKQMSGYKDSEEMIQEMYYEKACKYMDEERYNEAISIFDTTTGFKDSKILAIVCGSRLSYNDALKKAGREDYEGALDILDGIKRNIEDNGIDFSIVLDKDGFETTRDECYKHACYNNGKSLFDQALFYSAYLEFSKVSGMLDADELAKSCVQPIETKEIYVNPDHAENEAEVIFIVRKDCKLNICVKVYTGKTLVSLCLIKRGETLKIELPSNIYSFNSSEGIDWYGEKEYFGDEGSYYKWIFDEKTRLSEEQDTQRFLIPSIISYTYIFGGEEGNIGLVSITRSEF